VNNDPRRGERVLSKDEVNVIGKGGLIDLGAHTMTHRSLKGLSISQQMKEISGSKTQLEHVIGRPVKSFSYPHGDYSMATRELVQRAGFQGATTTIIKSVLPNTDPFQLPRFQVDDWNGAEFLRHLVRWYALY
jgi:peptidoglycan/xylan/chitin deacetylase (PgdA/CDA1 family)